MRYIEICGLSRMKRGKNMRLGSEASNGNSRKSGVGSSRLSTCLIVTKSTSANWGDAHAYVQCSYFHMMSSP